MEPFWGKEADLRFSEPRNSVFDQCQNMEFLFQEKHSSRYRRHKNGAGPMHMDRLPKVLLGHTGRGPWAGHCSDWRAENAAREELCCCSTEPAGPKATHLVETSRAGAPRRDWDRRTVVNTWLESCSSSVSLSLKGCPC